MAELTLNPAKAPAAEEDDDDVDLFGSDEEEEDQEAAKLREERLAEYRKKKESKPKPAAKSIARRPSMFTCFRGSPSVSGGLSRRGCSGNLLRGLV